MRNYDNTGFQLLSLNLAVKLPQNGYNSRIPSRDQNMTSKIFLSLILAFVLAGCGQSGPLYVPGDPSSVEAKPQTVNDDEREENGEDESP